MKKICVVLSIIIALYLIEIIMVIFGTFKDGIQWTSRFDEFNKLKKIHDNAVVTLHGAYLINKNKKIFPLAGISNRETLYCNESAKWMIYKSDRYGFNNFEDIYNKKIRIAAIGDSYAHGACVDRRSHISAVLNIEFDLPSVNLAYGGNGLLQSYAALKEYAKFFKPESIVLFFSENDVSDFMNEMDNPILIKYFEDDKFTQNLINRQKEIDVYLEGHLKDEINKIEKGKTNIEPYSFIAFLKLRYTRYLLTFGKNYLKLFLKNSSFYISQNEKADLKLTPQDKNFYNERFPYNEVNTILKKYNKFSKEINADFKIAYLPSICWYTNEVDWFSCDRKYLNIIKYNIKKISEENKIDFIDVQSYLEKKYKDPLDMFPFKRGPHYTVEAYKIIANYINEYYK
jgi:hypothetical protein